MITVTGDFRFNPRALTELAEKTRATERGAAHAVKRVAKSMAPVDTGDLQTSIKAKREAKNQWAVYTETGYGGFVELGTQYQRAQPYMVPAVQIVAYEIGKGTPLKDVK